jgi:hypothetical protein
MTWLALGTRMRCHHEKMCNLSSTVQKRRMPLGRPSSFVANFPRRGHSYTLGDPTFCTFCAATGRVEDGKSYPFRCWVAWTCLTMAIYRICYSKGCVFRNVTTPRELSIYLIKTIQSFVENEQWPERWGILYLGRSGQDGSKSFRIRDAETQVAMYLPWFYDSNRNHFPA